MEGIRFPLELEKERTRNLASYYSEIMQCRSCRKKYGMDEPKEGNKANRKGICPRCSLRGRNRNLPSDQLKMAQKGIQYG